MAEMSRHMLEQILRRNGNTLLKSLAIGVLVSALAHPARASERGPGQISDVQIDGDKAVFYVSGPIVNKPSCVVWDRLVFEITTPSGQAKLAYLLSARTEGRLIRVYGTGSCSIAAEHETAHSLRDG